MVGQRDRALEDGDLEPEVATERSADESMRTRVGGVLGTAAYMPPEQARGEVDRLDARADVYAVGAMLYEALAGRPPYEGRDSRAILRQVLSGPPEPPRRNSSAHSPRSTLTFAFDEADPDDDAEGAGPPPPDDLVALCMWCMEREPADRPADGATVGTELRAWLEGAGKRAKALEVVAQANALVGEAQALRQRAIELRAEGEALLADVPSSAPEQQKAPGWEKEDEAERVERQASLLELKREALLRGALTHAPDLAEAHAALVDLERARHEAAESVRDGSGAARAEALLREHQELLPEGHPTRVAAAAYLKGDGALSLVTDADGADVLLYRYELRHRRLVEVPVRSLGRTPLKTVPLPIGSYLCVLKHPERADVRYPVRIGRGEHWDGVPPGASDPLPIRLPRPDELGPDERLVPAGWFWSGGDPHAVDSLPGRRLWCDELVVGRFPVTFRQYIAFLDDLVATGAEADAVRYQPRERALGEGAPVLGRDADGRFVLVPDADGDRWDPEWPAALVDWWGAHAYASWLARRTSRPWRLPGELEWEKAARGVDARHYPWGDFLDPSWACIRPSHVGRGAPAVVDSFPVDESPYGLRGLAGNVQEWTADVFRREPPLDGDRVLAPSATFLPASSEILSFRGGFWMGTARNARPAARFRTEPSSRSMSLGFRLVWRAPATG